MTGLPRWLSGEESMCSAGDAGLIPGSGRSPGGGNGSPLQYSCLGKPMDRGAWWATVPGIAEWDVTEHAHIVLDRLPGIINWNSVLEGLDMPPWPIVNSR